MVAVKACPKHSDDQAMDSVMSPKQAGRLSSLLYIGCGLLLVPSSLWLPLARGSNRPVLVGLSVLALVSGIIIGAMPWDRWPHWSILWLNPPTFALIAFYNGFAGNDGYRYATFFFITFAWIGLVLPRWMSLKVMPLAVAAYFLLETASITAPMFRKACRQIQAVMPPATRVP